MDFTIYVSSLTGSPEELPSCTVFREIPETVLAVSRQYVSEVRAHLAQPFRNMPNEELMVARFMLAAKKSG